MTSLLSKVALVLAGVAAARTVRSWYTHRSMFSRIPKGDPTPPKKETEEVVLAHVGEMDLAERKVFEWRFEQLEAHGFDELRAVSLALKPGDAWRRAIEHVRRGATHKVAAEIEL